MTYHKIWKKNSTKRSDLDFHSNTWEGSDLDVKGSTAILSATLVVKHHPGFVLVEAGAFPLEIVDRRKGGADEDGEEIHRAVEAIEDGPRQLSRQQRKHVSRVKRRFQGPNLRGRYAHWYQEEQQKPRYLHLRHGTSTMEERRRNSFECFQSQLWILRICSSLHFVWHTNYWNFFVFIFIKIEVCNNE